MNPNIQGNKHSHRHAISMARRLLRTDWRAGELQLLCAALLLAVTLVTGLTAFVERLQWMLAGESSQFLAADRVLQSPYPINQQWVEGAAEYQLEQAKFVSFQSMLFADDEPLLVSAKAVSSSYPLIGEVKIKNTEDGVITPLTSGPKQGELWAEQRLLEQLSVSLGDEVYIGDAPLLLSKVLVSEPDRGLGFVSMGPRVLMHWQDIDATGVIQEGSRLKYAQLFKGQPSDIQDFQAWLVPQLSDTEKWLDLENSQPTVALSLARAKNFFLLASSMVFILAAIAIAMASTRYCQRHVKHIAVLKTLGASSNLVLNIYLYVFIALLLAVLMTGFILAYVLQHLALSYAASLLESPLPAISVKPFAMGFLTAVLSLCSFSLPAIIKLKNISAIRIFQQIKVQEIAFSRASLLFGFMGLLLLLLLYTQQWLLTLLLLSGLVILLLCIFLPVKLLLSLVKTNGMQAGHWWHLAWKNIQRRLSSNALQLSLLSMSLMLLVVLLGLRDNLFTQWQEQLPEKTPNHFLINLQDNDLQAVEAWLNRHGAESEHIYPMTRGRLIKVNGEPVRQRVSKESFQRSGADRELNLSSAKALPQDNTLSEGQWFNDNTATMTQVSVESQLAEKLDLALGDELTFMIAAEEKLAKVTSFREVEWDRMRPNFYMLFEENALADFPRTYMTSFYLNSDQLPLITQLIKSVPTAVVIDVNSLIEQIRSIIAHVALALQCVLWLVLLATILVMIATVQSALDSRKKENTILRALGGSKLLIVGSIMLEFALMGFLAGILATIIAEGVLCVVQIGLMKLPFGLHPNLWWIAPSLGCFIVTTLGFLSAKRITSHSPMQLLRES